jgi:hypothetical protein
VGLVITAVGWIFYEWLDITGPVLAGVGALGTLHGLLWHSRWVEVKSRLQSPAADPMLIYTTRRKSGRKLIKMLREKIRPAS